jgi:hypothetical protein
VATTAPKAAAVAVFGAQLLNRQRPPLNFKRLLINNMLLNACACTAVHLQCIVHRRAPLQWHDTKSHNRSLIYLMLLCYYYAPMLMAPTLSYNRTPDCNQTSQSLHIVLPLLLFRPPPPPTHTHTQCTSSMSRHAPKHTTQANTFYSLPIPAPTLPDNAARGTSIHALMRRHGQPSAWR